MSDNHKFTILGEQGSGKTCYLLGMYYEMSMGVAGFTVDATDPGVDRNLSIRYDMLKDKSRGAGRFPLVTDDLQKIEFMLRFANSTIGSFEWVDYPGVYLDSRMRDIGREAYKEFEEYIKNSYMLFICVDGANLVGKSTEEKIRNVKTKCARNITPYLGKLKDSLKNQNKFFPPVGIIVTKYDLCIKDTDEKEICEIVEEAFEPLFLDEEAFISVIPVSLGDTLEDDDRQGELAPINMELPILLGMNFAVVDELNYGKYLIEKDNEHIERARAKKREEDDRWAITRWLFGGSDPDKLAEDIFATQKQIEQNRQVAYAYKRNLKKINRRLDDLELIFFNGSWLDENSRKKFWDEFQSIVNYFDESGLTEEEFSWKLRH